MHNKYIGTSLLENGVIHQSTYRDTPKKVRFVLEVARVIMFSMNVLNISGVMYKTAYYLVNIISFQILKFETTLQVLKRIFYTSWITINLSIKVLGCICYVYISNILWSKLDLKVKKCVYIGYAYKK